ncbi:MAG: D-2-hydroxyacid dehydrogenase [Rubrobacter sp.]|nr:D-2-hydroxyacid dehydrogenase [Rubrobacter sp.]
MGKGNAAKKNTRPILAILGAAKEDPPPNIETVMGNAEVRFAPDGETLKSILPGVEALFIWDFRASELRDAWSFADELRWVHVAGAGVDAALFPELVESGVVVTNSRGVFDRSIAEYVVGTMLVFEKDLLRTLTLQRRKEWRHRESGMLSGKTLLVVGAGPIGRMISTLAKNLGMKPSAVARTAKPEDPDFERVFAHEELDAALPHADYVVIAAPLTDETRDMFGAEQFGRMKSEARLINIGRGKIVDEAALTAALREKKISGAALDVFREEPLPPESPLWEMDEVIISPHMSGDFVGWTNALGELIAENFRRWSEGEELFNIVDKERGYGRSAPSSLRSGESGAVSPRDASGVGKRDDG